MDIYIKNSRPFFAYVKRKRKSRLSISPMWNKKGEMVTEDGSMAEVLNEFFSSVFTREDTNNATTEKVKKIIRKLRTAAAAGPDVVGPRVL